MIQSMRIRLPAIFVGVASLLASPGGAVHASDTAAQTVDITVQAVNEIALGTAVTLNVNSAAAGINPTGLASSTYSITTNSTASKKITAQLLAAPTSGLTLSVNLQAPSTGVSAGSVPLGVAPVDAVNSIEAVTASGLTISYAAAATVAVAPTSYSAEVTYTIVND
ncbi:MAG TPA: hypothetical protein VIV63_10390 [Steroidobacteraceae bacterium]